MSGFLHRVAARTAPAVCRIAPKGLVRRAPPEEGEEAPEDGAMPMARVASPVRRAPSEPGDTGAPDEEGAAQPLRRKAEEAAEEEEPLTRAAAGKISPEEDMPIDRAVAPGAGTDVDPKERTEEPPVTALRRAGVDGDGGKAPEEEEEPAPASPLRRAAAAEGGEAETPEEPNAAPLRRTAADATRNDGPMPEEMRDEPEPPTVTALRREPVAPVQGAPDMTAGDGGFFGGRAQEQAPPLPAFAVPEPHISQAFEFSAPSVTIDRLDVLIHEPAPSTPRAGLQGARAVRARYLRRL